MPNSIDFYLATSEQIEGSLCNQLETIRLTRNLTQSQLAVESGVALRTIGRLERGQGVSLNTFIRVMVALGLQQNLQALLPDPSVRPMDRINIGGRERKRAHPDQQSDEKSTWTWGDESVDRK